MGGQGEGGEGVGEFGRLLIAKNFFPLTNKADIFQSNMAVKEI